MQYLPRRLTGLRQAVSLLKTPTNEQIWIIGIHQVDLPESGIWVNKEARLPSLLSQGIDWFGRESPQWVKIPHYIHPHHSLCVDWKTLEDNTALQWQTICYFHYLSAKPNFNRIFLILSANIDLEKWKNIYLWTLNNNISNNISKSRILSSWKTCWSRHNAALKYKS